MRRFPMYWGILTATYGSAVLYRAITQSTRPGLPTFAAIAAIAAVWFGFFDVVNTRLHLRAAIVIAISATILLNTAVIVSSAVRGHGLPAEQSVFTLIFLYVLIGKVQELHAQRHTQRKRQHDA